MAWFVYILSCSDNSLYTGIKWNLEKRLKEHNSGTYQSFTKSRRPVRLVYWERLSGKTEAAKREKEIKGWTRMKKEQLIKSLH